MSTQKRVFLTGGGTAGSVMPVLAIAEHLDGVELYFVGTRNGVERTLVGSSMQYISLPAGKLRRYADIRNIIDPFIIVWAFLQSCWLMMRYRPAVVVSTGSFVSVPVIWAAWLFGRTTIVHQQDLQVGLATKLTKPFTTYLTKAFEEIPLPSAQLLGNPVRNLTPTTHTLELDDAVPTILIFGGGTGAQGVNELVSETLCEFANVIHLTGLGKAGADISHKRYHAYELLKEEMKEALHAADLVICRAGLSTISELAALSKPAIIIPIPNSHQEHNAQFLETRSAALILRQTQLTAGSLAQDVKTLLSSKEQLEHFGKAIHNLMPADASQALANIIKQHTV